MPERRTIKVPKFNSYNPKSTSKTQCKSEIQTKPQLRQFEKNETKKRPFNHSNNSHQLISEEPDLKINSQNRDTTDHFVIDVKGDENNLQYGSLHKYSVPKYHRYGAGQVLGARPTLRINRDLVNEKWIVLSHTESFKKLTRQKNIFSKVKKHKPRTIKVRSEVVTRDQAYPELDFIALRSGRSNQMIGNEKNSRNDDVGSPDSNFSTLSGKTPNRFDPDHDLDSEFSESDQGQYIDENYSALEKNAMLSRQVEKSPCDTEAWLSFINHQDKLILKDDDHRRITQAMVKSIADAKINLYEKALKHSKSLKNRERLLIGLMSEGEKMWELRTQASRWEQISRNNIDSLFLWTKYIDFKQFTLSIFRYEEVKNVYLQRLKYLSQAAKNEQENAENYYLELLHVLLRATVFIRDAGYSELAISIWQINLEINFCATGVDLEQDDCVNLFREFWESEVPRIGEEGARGFRHYIDNQDTSGVMETSIDESQDILDKENIFESWAAAERLRSKPSKIPAKTLDEVVEDDPFRVILFTDIQDFLCFLPPESSKVHRSCINAFLSFCRLPPLVNLDDNQNEVSDDTFIIDGLVRSELDWLESDCSSNREENREYGVKSFCLAPIPKFLPSPESLFYNITDFQGKPRSFRDRFPDESGPVRYSYIRSSLEQLTQNWPDDSLAEYYLSFENANEPETIKKVSKALLKQKPSSLRLYNAYALIEWSRGNKEITEGVFSAALNMGKTITSNETDHETLILLWKSWIWICLECKDSLIALKYLICIVDGMPDVSFNISSTLLLRAKQHLTSKRDFLISRNSVFGVIYSECLAVLEYLSCSHGQEILLDTQRDIVSAMDIYDSTSRLLDDRKQKISQELLLQSAARLLFFHCQCGPYRPAQIREYLTDFLQKFPKNTIFLSFYSWNESRLRIDNRVRNILLNTILIPQNDSVTSRLFAIRHEIRSGTIHSVKAAFEHSVSSPVTRNSAGLWQLYLLYCLKTPQLQSEVKSVWYRAIRSCPSVKELYIFGFEKLGKILDFSELKRTWKIMEEIELRVHVNLEDEFDDCENLKR